MFVFSMSRLALWVVDIDARLSIHFSASHPHTSLLGNGFCVKKFQKYGADRKFEMDENFLNIDCFVPLVHCTCVGAVCMSERFIDFKTL